MKMSAELMLLGVDPVSNLLDQAEYGTMGLGEQCQPSVAHYVTQSSSNEMAERRYHDDLARARGSVE